MRRRTSTGDLERLAKAAYDECVELVEWMELRPAALGFPYKPLPPMSDPGTGPGWSRRHQAKHDLVHWRRERERLLTKLGTMRVTGELVMEPPARWTV